MNKATLYARIIVYRPSRHNAAPCVAASSSKFVAPSTTPIMLYLLEKNLIQSFSTPFSFSSKSFHSGETSSGLVDDFARAREASLPANTRQLGQLIDISKGA